jgi:zinc transport system substrate-binding protein
MIKGNSKFKLLMFLIIISLFVSGCSPVLNNINNSSVNSEKKIDILTSFFPVYDITKHLVNGTNLKVDVLVPVGANPHTFDFSSKDIEKIINSKVFIKYGFFLENTEDKLIKNNPNLYVINPLFGVEVFNLKNNTLTKVKGIKFKPANKESCLNQGGQYNPCDSACDSDKLNTSNMVCTQQCVPSCLVPKINYDNVDPHIWLDINNMEIMAKNIEKSLSEKYPQYSFKINENYKKYINNLELLKKEYNNSLKNCNINFIISEHLAYNYLGKEFGFNVYSLKGTNPMSDVKSSDLINITNLIRNKNVKYIFGDEGINNKLVKTLSEENKIQFLELKPFATKINETYFDIMKYNLKEISKAMACK